MKVWYKHQTPFWHLGISWLCDCFPIREKKHKLCRVPCIQWSFPPRCVTIDQTVLENNVKSLDDKGHKVLIIPCLIFWVRWAKNTLICCTKYFFERWAKVIWHMEKKNEIWIAIALTPLSTIFHNYDYVHNFLFSSICKIM